MYAGKVCHPLNEDAVQSGVAFNGCSMRHDNARDPIDAPLDQCSIPVSTVRCHSFSSSPIRTSIRCGLYAATRLLRSCSGDSNESISTSATPNSPFWNHFGITNRKLRTTKSKEFIDPPTPSSPTSNSSTSSSPKGPCLNDHEPSSLFCLSRSKSRYNAPSPDFCTSNSTNYSSSSSLFGNITRSEQDCQRVQKMRTPTFLTKHMTSPKTALNHTGVPVSESVERYHSSTRTVASEYFGLVETDIERDNWESLGCQYSLKVTTEGGEEMWGSVGRIRSVSDCFDQYSNEKHKHMSVTSTPLPEYTHVTMRSPPLSWKHSPMDPPEFLLPPFSIVSDPVSLDGVCLDQTNGTPNDPRKAESVLEFLQRCFDAEFDASDVPAAQQKAPRISSPLQTGSQTHCISSPLQTGSQTHCISSPPKTGSQAHCIYSPPKTGSQIPSGLEERVCRVRSNSVVTDEKGYSDSTLNCRPVTLPHIGSTLGRGLPSGEGSGHTGTFRRNEPMTFLSSRSAPASPVYSKHRSPSMVAAEAPPVPKSTKSSNLSLPLWPLKLRGVGGAIGAKEENADLSHDGEPFIPSPKPSWKNFCATPPALSLRSPSFLSSSSSVDQFQSFSDALERFEEFHVLIPPETPGGRHSSPSANMKNRLKKFSLSRTTVRSKEGGGKEKQVSRLDFKGLGMRESEGFRFAVDDLRQRELPIIPEVSVKYEMKPSGSIVWVYSDSSRP